MPKIPKLETALKLRGRLIFNHSCIVKIYLIEYTNSTTRYTMAYIMFEVADYVEKEKETPN